MPEAYDGSTLQRTSSTERCSFETGANRGPHERVVTSNGCFQKRYKYFARSCWGKEFSTRDVDENLDLVSNGLIKQTFSFGKRHTINFSSTSLAGALKPVERKPRRCDSSRPSLREYVNDHTPSRSSAARTLLGQKSSQLFMDLCCNDDDLSIYWRCTTRGNSYGDSSQGPHAWVAKV